MSKFSTLFIFLFLFTSLAAQKKYVSGYIITLDQDTVNGWIRDRSVSTFPELYSKIRFKSSKQKLRKKYSPDEIMGYGYGKTHFESVPLQQEMNFLRPSYLVHSGAPKVFLKVVIRDEILTFYHMEYEDGDNGYLDFVPLFYRNGENEMVRVTQGILGLKRKRLSEYLSDCPGLVKAIQDKTMSEPLEVYYYYVQSCAF